MSRPGLRYGQCWEDGHGLLEALDPQPGAQLLSIASGGENSLALLSRPGVRVLAIDHNPAQIAALELKLAAFRRLDHGGMLQLLGARPAGRRERNQLYQRCCSDLAPASRAFWDGEPHWLAWGVLPVARFERYLGLFRRLILPLVHGPALRREALRPRSEPERREWYTHHWDNRRWRLLFRLCFNRTSLGHLGTDPASVRHGQGCQVDTLLAELRRVMVEGDPARNPYLHWLLRGRFAAELPLALQPQLFATIRSRLDQLQWRCQSLQQWLDQAEAEPIAGFNLSNVLEYVEAEEAGRLLERLHQQAAPAARLLLWNRLAERDTGLAPPGLWQPLEAEAQRLHRRSQVPFYRRLVLAEALPRPATSPSQAAPGMHRKTRQPLAAAEHPDQHAGLSRAATPRSAKADAGLPARVPREKGGAAPD